jgi:hypothetical protein
MDLNDAEVFNDQVRQIESAVDDYMWEHLDSLDIDGECLVEKKKLAVAACLALVVRATAHVMGGLMSDGERQKLLRELYASTCSAVSGDDGEADNKPKTYTTDDHESMNVIWAMTEGIKDGWEIEFVSLLRSGQRKIIEKGGGVHDGWRGTSPAEIASFYRGYDEGQMDEREGDIGPEDN